MTDIFLIDATSYIFRAFHALPPLTTSQGLPTGALVGFAHMIQKMRADYPHQTIILFFDSSGPTHRHQWFSAYKAHRKEVDPALIAQVEAILELSALLGFSIVKEKGTEADDLIALAATHYANQGSKVCVVSPDKDFVQLLVHPLITIFHPMKKEMITRKEAEEKYGLKAEQFIDYFSLIGDSSDGIPGVPSIGPKTAQKLLSQYHSLDNLYLHLDELSPRQKTVFQDHQNNAYLSKKLFTFQDKDSLVWPSYLPLDVHTALINEPNIEKLAEFCQRYELKAFQSFLIKQHDRSPSVEVIFLENLSLVPWDRISQCAVIQESANTDDRVFEIGYELDKKWYYTYVFLSQEGNFLQKIQNRDVLTIFFDAKSFRNRHQNASVLFHDLLLIKHYLAPEKRWTLKSWEDSLDLDKSDCRSRHLMLQYQLGWEKLSARQRYFLESVDYPMIAILSRMEKEGVLIDKIFLENLENQWAHLQESLEQQVIALCGEVFNLNSPKQLGYQIFERLGLKSSHTTSKGQLSTNEEALLDLREQHPVIEHILEYRHLQKLRSTYSQAWLSRLEHSHRLHTTYDLCGTVTGRLSSYDPNLQNIPVRSSLGAQLRKAIIAPQGHVLVSFDYSQIELRLMAHFSQDHNLIKAYAERRDIHTETAQYLFGIDDCLEVTSEQRAQAKTVNFGLIYGMSAFGLSKQLRLSMHQAQTLMESYFDNFPSVREYMSKVREESKQKGYVETLGGRKIPIRLHDKNSWRAAVNGPLQGTASELIKKAMVAVENYTKTQGIKMVMQVHDELVFEIPNFNLEQHISVIKKFMEDVATLSVPLEVQHTTGLYWS